MVEVLLIVWVLLLSLRLCGWRQGMSSAPMLLSPGDKGMPCHPPVGAGGESESEVFSLITYLCLNKIYFVILPGNSNPLLQLEDSNLLLLLLLITTTTIIRIKSVQRISSPYSHCALCLPHWHVPVQGKINSPSATDSPDSLYDTTHVNIHLHSCVLYVFSVVFCGWEKLPTMKMK